MASSALPLSLSGRSPRPVMSSTCPALAAGSLPTCATSLLAAPRNPKTVWPGTPPRVNLAACAAFYGPRTSCSVQRLHDVSRRVSTSSRLARFGRGQQVSRSPCASLASTEGAVTHDLKVREDPKVKAHQANLFEFIKGSPGLGGFSDSLAAAQDPRADPDSAHIPRTIRVSADISLPPRREGMIGEEEEKEMREQQAQQQPVTESDWPLEWCAISAPGAPKLHLGSIPSSSAEMVQVLDAGKFDAVLVLLHPSEILALDVDINALGAVAEEKDKLLLHCPVLEGPPGGHRDHTGLGVIDVEKLKEALRVLTALVRTGQKVLVCCTCGTTASALLALCYLTFVEGMSLKAALALLKACAPGAAPPLAAWDDARLAWSTFQDSTRLARLADAMQQERQSQGLPGSASEDWMAARQQLIVEMLNEQADADVALAKIVTKSSQSEATGGVSPAAGQGEVQGMPLVYQNALENVAEQARQEEMMLRVAMQESSREAQRLATELAQAERQLAQAQVELKKVGESPGGEAAVGVSIDAFLMGTAMESALRQEQEARARIEALEAELRTESRVQSAAKERLEFLERESLRLREKEEASRKAAAVAVQEGNRLREQLARSEATGVKTSEQLKELESEVVLLQEQTKQAEETEKELVAVKSKVDVLESELSRARVVAASAVERSEFLMRQVAMLKEKLAEKKLDDKQAQQQAAKTAQETDSNLTITQLRAELAEARARQAKAEQERDDALVQVSTLSEKLRAAEKRMQEAAQKLLEAEDKIGYLLRQVETTRNKRRTAEDALTAAKEQVKKMTRTVAGIRDKLFKRGSAEEQGKPAEAAQSLINNADSLSLRLEEQAKKLQASNATKVNVAAELEKKTRHSKAADPWLDLTPLVDTLPAVLEAAEAASLAKDDVAEKEDILKNVTCLREAVEALDGPKGGNGDERAVGLFNELVKPIDSLEQARKYQGVQVSGPFSSKNTNGKAV